MGYSGASGRHRSSGPGDFVKGAFTASSAGTRHSAGMIKRRCIAAFAALATLGSCLTASAETRTPLSPDGDRCFADWSDAGPVVRREGLVAVKDVHELARQRRIGDLVRITLCEEHGRYVYRLVVREASGRIVALTTDARKPFER